MPPSPTPTLPARRRRSRRGAVSVVLTATALTVLLGCSKGEVATGDSTTTSGSARPAADATTGGSITGAGTSTTAMDATTTTTESSASTTTTAKGSTTTGKPDGSTTTTTTSGATTTSKSANTTTTATGGPTTSVVATAGDKALCDKIATLNKEFQDMDPTTDPTAFQKIKDTFQALVDVAPADIKPTLQEIADRFAKVFTLDDFGKIETDPVMKAAGDKMSAWQASHCGK